MEYDSCYFYLEEHVEFIKTYSSIKNDSLFCYLTTSSTSSIFLTIYNLIHQYNIKEYLVIQPAYFSFTQILKDQKCKIHNVEFNADKLLDLNVIEHIIRNNEIEAIIFTNPIYGMGYKYQNDILDSILSMCNKNGLWLLVDNVFGGMDWNDENNHLIDRHQYCTLLSYQKSIVIDSPTKKLFLNSIKFGLVYANMAFIKKLNELNEYINGSFSEIHIQLLKNIYSEAYIGFAKSAIADNMASAKKNYMLYKNIISEDTYFAETNCGFHTMLFYKNKKLSAIQQNEFVKDALKEHSIFIIPAIDFGIGESSDFGIRINLLKRHVNHAESISKMSNFDVNFFD